MAIRKRRNIIKLKKGSEGYKAGIRYIDIGVTVHTPTKFLKKSPRTKKRHGRPMGRRIK